MPIFYFYALENKASEEGKDLFSKTSDTESADGAKAEKSNSDTINSKEESSDTTRDEKKTAHATPEECLGSFFADKHSLELPVLKSSGKGDKKVTFWDKHKCEVLRHEGGVILMTVEANKSKHTIVDKKDVEHPHHPYCTVIIDNRPGRQLVGIERNSAFNSNPDNLAALLQESVNYMLSPYGRRIELLKLKKNSKEFWPVVDRLRTTYGDRVKQVRLDLSGKEGKDAANAEKMDASLLMSLISQMAAKTQSDASLMLYATENGEVRLQEVHEDVSHIADLCLTHKNYDLTVKFEKFGVYRYGSDLLAQFGVDDEVLTHFSEGSLQIDFDKGEPVYALTEWLDKLDTLLKDYGKNTVSAARKAPRRRKVS